MATSNPSFILQETGIVLGIPQQDPTFFNLDFLTYTGIIPGSWDISSPPQRSPQVARIRFQNDLSLIAEPQQTSFIETLGEKGMEEIETPRVAMRFIEIMKNINFTSLHINFRGYVAFPDEPRAAHDYFFKTFLAPGDWHNIGTAPVRGGLNLVYTFDKKKLDLMAQEAAIRRLDESSVAALVFTGSFESNLATIEEQNRLDAVREGIDAWNNDLKQFIGVVSRFFNQGKPQTKPPTPAPTTIPL
jgi:hypothetical protein